MSGHEQRRAKIVVAGAGEPSVDALRERVEARGVAMLLVTDSLADEVAACRPNLVLLVGDATLDDGASGIDEVRRVSAAPVVVTTDPEPLDRRLSPFQYGASGVLVRRSDADEMAGELLHLLAEAALRAAPGDGDRTAGLESRELRAASTPSGGAAAAHALVVPRPSDMFDGDDLVTRRLPVASEPPTPIAVGLPEWDEDLTTKKTPQSELARWRRLSAQDRSILPTPRSRPAIEARARPTPRSRPGMAAAAIADDALADEPTVGALDAPVPAVLSVPPDADELITSAEFARALVLAPDAIVSPPPRADEPTRDLSRGDAEVAAPISSNPPPRRSPTPVAPRPRKGLSPFAPSSGSLRVSPSGEEPSGEAARTSGPPSVSALVAIGGSAGNDAPSLASRASTLREDARPKPRASVVPAVITLVVLIVASAGLAVPIVERLIARAPSAPVTTIASTLPDEPPPSAVAPSAVTPSADAPSAATPGTEAPRAVTPSAVAPSAVTPSAVAPSAVTPSAVAPSAITPSTVAPSAITPSAITPSAPPEAEDPTADTEPPARDRDASDALVREAAERARASDHDAEHALLEQALAADPDNPHALVAMARERVSAGDAEAAIRYAERAVSLRRRRGSYHVVLGDARSLAGDRHGARAEWELALELEPDSADARRRLDP